MDGAGEGIPDGRADGATEGVVLGDDERSTLGETLGRSDAVGATLANDDSRQNEATLAGSSRSATSLQFLAQARCSQTTRNVDHAWNFFMVSF